MLGRKQSLGDATVWAEAIRSAREKVSDAELDRLIETTLEHVSSRRGNAAYAWSGGKDSQILRWIMEKAGITDCMIGMTTGLEWPAMLRWITDHMPPGCEVIAVPLDLPWLAARPHMLFPQGRYGPHWFSLVQHKAQRQFVRDTGVTTLALGRRRRDGNYVGAAGGNEYTDRTGVTRWSPLADWTHEQMFALIEREHLPLPPCYDWPRGFQVGTGPWPARQWTTDVDHGFEECWQIDPQVIRKAAERLPAAAAWIERTGR